MYCDLYKIPIDVCLGSRSSYSLEDLNFYLDINGYYGRYRLVDIYDKKQPEKKFKQLKVYLPDSYFEYNFNPLIDIKVDNFYIKKHKYTTNKNIHSASFHWFLELILNGENVVSPGIIARKVQSTPAKVNKMIDLAREFGVIENMSVRRNISKRDLTEIEYNIFNFISLR